MLRIIKRFFAGSLVFVISLFFGCFVVSLFHFRDATSQPSATSQIEIVANLAKPAEPLFVPEFRDLPNSDEMDNLEFNTSLIDIVTEEDTFMPEDIQSKTGQIWLALIEGKDDRFSLNSSKITVKKYPATKNVIENVRVKFNLVTKPVFATRGLNHLRTGNVTTLHYERPNVSDTDSDENSMSDGFRREFRLGGTTFVLRVSTGLTKDGERIDVLVLGNGNKDQIIDRSPVWDGSKTNLGKLIWVGDLDHDGKLDLYIDRSLGEEKAGTGLFLSSYANPSDLVKLIALFGHSGC